MSGKSSRKQLGGGCGCAGNNTKRMVMTGGSCGMGSCPIQLGGRKKSKKTRKVKRSSNKKSKRSRKH